uniref:G-protein coupled receptors family 1 profile domain-containing protein n=1 Tax=Astyanax mexicanus TaxID=7994 RepID=W5KEX7_ASTMX
SLLFSLSCGNAGNWSNSSSGSGSSSSSAFGVWEVLTSLLLGALILMSIVGNACVIAAIALERSLQTINNYLIGSLAVTDLLVSVLVLPMAALYQVLQRWTLGQVACDLFIALDVLCCTSSILHLCAIALDRYWAITDPVAYMTRRTLCRAATLISLTWLVGFSISIPPMLGWRTPEDRANPLECTISQDPGYTIFSTFGAFYIPLALMLVLYGRIFRAARFRIRRSAKKNTDKMKMKEKEKDRKGTGLTGNGAPSPCTSVTGTPDVNRVSSPDDPRIDTPDGTRASTPDSTSLGSPEVTRVGTPEGISLEGTELLQDSRGALARERRTVKTLGIIMGTFILCWLPFFIVALVLPFCGSSCPMPPWLGAVINWLGYANSLLNPVIYAYFNRDFQNAFRKMLRCRFSRQ